MKALSSGSTRRGPLAQRRGAHRRPADPASRASRSGRRSAPSESTTTWRRQGKRGSGRDPERRHDLAHHAEIVDRPGAVGEKHRGGVRLAEDVGHVLGAEARVDRTSTAPIFMMANIASIHSGRFTIQSATLSPGAMPRARSPSGHRVDAGVHLGERPASPLEGERLARAPPPSRPLGQESDRLLRVPVAHDGLRVELDPRQAPVPPAPPSRCLRRKSSTSRISRSESSSPPGSGACSSLAAASYSCSSFRTCSRVARSRATA